MNKIIPTVLVLGAIGVGGYYISQATVPASQTAYKNAEATMQKINLTGLLPSATPTATPAATPATPTATALPVDQPTTKPDQTVVQRNQYADSAKQALETEVEKLNCARAAQYRKLAEQHQIDTGGSQEAYLLQLLQAKNQELGSVAMQTGGFSGDAGLQATGRSLTMDTLAIVQALQNLYQSQAPSCLSDPTNAVVVVSDFNSRANLYRWQDQQRRQESITKDQQAATGGQPSGNQ